MTLGASIGPILPPAGSGGGGGSGTVTSVSIVSANGLAGTVATATTTPAITLSTTVTGIAKGNGTTFSAATAGTDYPATGVISAGGPTGSTTVVPVITWNANGQLTAVTTATISGTTPGGSAGGDLTGTYPNPTIKASVGLTGTPTAPTASPGTSTTQLATTAFVEAALPTVVPSQFTYSAITADPNPAVIGTYYHANYAANGNFTLPSSALTAGDWIHLKHVDTHTITIVGTVDGNASYSIATQYVGITFVYNGTNWDAF